MTLTYQEAWNAQPDGRSREEIFKSIVNRIKADSPTPISDVEAHQAAHRLITLVSAMAGLDSNGFPLAPDEIRRD